MTSPEMEGYTVVSERTSSRDATLQKENSAVSESRSVEVEVAIENEQRMARLGDKPDPQFELACSRFIGGLASAKETIEIESDSVYGAALVMPQVARSMGWPRALVVMTMSSIFCLLMTVGLHVSLLVYIDKEEKVFDRFGGQMYLCDFGVHLEQCTEDPDSPGCMGPGGTKMSAPRLYDWSTWVTRNFVRDSFNAMFPHMTRDEINEKVDPGEYGVESYWCRVICVFIFILTLVPEAKLCSEMAQLLWYVPAENASWVEVNEGGEKLLDQLQVKTAGMGWGWKVFSMTFVLLPKSCLLLWTAKAGVFFLMETAAIDAIIVNSVALGFLLSLDELVYECLLDESSRLIMTRCQGFVPGEEDGLQERSDSRMSHCAAWSQEKTLKTFYTDQKLSGVVSWLLLIRDFLFSATRRVWIVTLVFVGFVSNYYLSVCQMEDGRWVSKPAHLPTSLNYNAINAIFSFTQSKEEKPYWTMPETE